MKWISILHFLAISEPFGRGSRKIVRTKGVAIFRETVFAGHDGTMEHMNSHQLFMYAQDMLKIKPAQILAWIGKGSGNLTTARGTIGN